MRSSFNSEIPAVQYWPADRGPTPREREILRRIAKGGLYVNVTRRGCSLSFTFGDGTSVTDACGRFGRDEFAKFVALSWIVADPDAPALFPDLAPAQRYLAAPAWRSR